MHRSFGAGPAGCVKDAELSASTIELATAKSGLVITQLTVEKLKAQIAKLRREKFGASSATSAQPRLLLLTTPSQARS